MTVRRKKFKADLFDPASCEAPSSAAADILRERRKVVIAVAANIHSALRTLGEHPTEGGTITVRDGRYGPYVNHGKVNATLAKDMDPATITRDQAVALIAARAEKGPGRPKRRSTPSTICSILWRR